MTKAIPRLSRYILCWYALAFALLLSAACSTDNSPQQHIARAEQYISGAEYTAAAIELKNALLQESDSAQARWLLGKIYFDTGDFAAAEKELIRAQELGWSGNDVRPILAGALLEQRKFVRVREMQYDDLEPGPSARVLAIKALAEQAQGEFAIANELIAAALEIQPESTEIKIIQARVLANLGDLTGALSIVDEVLAETQDEGEAWSLKGAILVRQQQLPAALAALGQAIALSHNTFENRYRRALVNLQLNEHTAAMADAELIMKTSPLHPAANYVQGVLYFRDKRYAEAIIALSMAEPAAKQFPLVLFYLGSANLQVGNLGQADFFAMRFNDGAPDTVSGLKLQATIRLQQDKFDDVQELVQPVLDGNPQDIGALQLMASALLGSGKTEQGIVLLQQLAQLQPDSATAQAQLGAGLMAVGQSDEAQASLDAALKLGPEDQKTEILLVLNHVRNKDFGAAVETAESFLDRNPDSAVPLNLLGKVYLASGQRKEAEKYFEEVLDLDPGDSTANQNLAQLEMAEGDLAAARARYDVILKHHPDSLQAMLLLAYLDAREGKGEALIMRLNQAIEAHPIAIRPRLLLGRYYLAQGEPEKVAALLSTLNELQLRSPEVLKLQALAQLSRQEPADARYTLEQLIKSSSETAATYHLMAMAASNSNDLELAREELKKALELDTDYLPSLIAMARLARAENSNEEFLQYLKRAAEIAPEDSEVLKLRAAAAQDQGENASAVALSLKAYAAEPSTQTVLELAAYHQAGANAQAALEVLQQWVKDHPEDIKTRMALADDLYQAKMLKERESQYLAILELDADNVTALNNLAWQIRLEDPSRALQYSRRATILSPDNAAILDTLAVIEHLNGENDKASRNIQRALARAPGEPSLLYHQAMIEAAQGGKTAAVAILERLLDRDDAKFPEREEAQALLVFLRG